MPEFWRLQFHLVSLSLVEYLLRSTDHAARADSGSNGPGWVRRLGYDSGPHLGLQTKGSFFLIGGESQRASGEEMIFETCSKEEKVFSRESSACAKAQRWEWWVFFQNIAAPFDLDFSGGSDGKEFSCNAGDMALILGSGRSPGEGHGYPPQYSCLGNFMDRGAWQAI